MKPNHYLKKERERRGWSQAKVAREIGVEPHSVSRWERGVSHPYPFYREKLCALFGTDAEALGLLSNIDGEETYSFDIVDPASVALLSTQNSLLDPAIPPPSPGPGELVDRHYLLNQLKIRLLKMGTGAITLLQGLPGVGKTALACAIAYDPEIRAYFHAGILWASIGPTPNVLKHLVRWGTLLGCASEQNSQVEDWAEAIHAQVDQQPMLFIIDNVWQIETILALKVGGNNCAYLITSRLPQVARYFGPEEVLTVPELETQDSLTLLEHFVPALVEQDTAIAQLLVRAVGGLPLGLTLIGKYLRAQDATRQPHRLRTAIRQIQNTAFRLRLSEPSSFIEHHSSLPVGAPLSLSAIIALSEQWIDKFE